MNRIRNAVIIIVLCIIGAAAFKASHKNDLGLGARPDDIRDAVAGNPVKPHHASLSVPTTDDSLKDSLAEGPAIPTGLRRNAPHGNTEDQTPPPPRGGDHNGIGNLGGQNPGAQLPPPPAPLSPSAPQQPN